MNKGKSIKFAAGCFLVVVSIVLGIFLYKSIYSSKKSAKETATTENTTEQITEKKTEKETNEEQNNNIKSNANTTMYVYNKILGDKNISVKGEVPGDVEKIINMITDDKNLVYDSKDYKDFYDEIYASSTYPEGGANPNDIYDHIKQHVNSLKDLELNNTLNIENDEQNLTYLGNNTWSLAKNGPNEISVKVYSTENLEYPSLPYTTLVARFCMPTGLADSDARNKSEEEQYKEFSDDDVQKYFNNTTIDSENISTAKVIAMSTQKIDCSNESLYIYKDPSSYINIFASTASNSGSTGYAYDKDDYNHATGFSNEENCYEYLKLNNESFYREAHEDIYYKADEFKSDYVKPDESFLGYFLKNYKFLYTFNVSVENDPYIVQVYNKDDAYVSLLLSTSKDNNPQQIWVSDNEGTILISDAYMNSEKDSSKALDKIKESVSYAKEHLGNEKDKKKKQQKTEEPTINEEVEGLGDLVPQTEIVKDLIEQIKNNKPITFDYIAKTNGPEIFYYNTSDGNNTYAKTVTLSIDKSCTMIVYDNVKYTAVPDNSNEPEVYWVEELTEREPTYKTMFLPEPLNHCDELEYRGAYKTRVGVTEQWQYKDKLVSFDIVDEKLYAISYRNINGEDTIAKISKYKKKASSNLLKKPENTQ